MIRAFTLTFLLLTTSGLAIAAEGGAEKDKPKSRPAPVLKNVSASDTSDTSFQMPASLSVEKRAEQEMLDLANQSRAQAGMPALEMDEGLTKAAREHAVLMAEQQQLSHQFAGEAGLPRRLAAQTSSHLEREGENVAYAMSTAQAHSGLMHSPPHRENLLNANFNVAGFAVIRSGDRLYVVEDFAHSLPHYSARQAEGMIAADVVRTRLQQDLSGLEQTDGSTAESAACSMAGADSLNAAALQGHYVLRYTTMQPESLPQGVAKVLADPQLRSFAVGSCDARSNNYPNGVYWVTIILN